MFNIGGGELALILVVALLVLGPKRLPELARGLGKFLREFRRQTDEVRSVVEREFYRMDQDLDDTLPRRLPGPPRTAELRPPPGEPSAPGQQGTSPAPVPDGTVSSDAQVVADATHAEKVAGGTLPLPAPSSGAPAKAPGSTEPASAPADETPPARPASGRQEP